ncbi:MAG: phosphoribosylformylglycinamidine synthase subunit PurQ [Ignavibacteria bacterium]|nr:phosphoribosylformylglycinamidine synthase subunit PurQ [Ignavibacteria bacterium]
MSKAKFGVVVFPGSNCDHDAYYVLKNLLNQDVKFLWHKDSSVGDRNVIVLPGGFSYGDYLRCGAIARFSPLMKDILKFAEKGGIVIGICNGFQILCEAGLLPGALLRNQSLRFICKTVRLKIENKDSKFTNSFTKDLIDLPVAHGEGNYYCDEETLNELRDKNRIVFRYSENPNGSLDDIAGICNEKGNVLGMMPHPERAAESIIGGTDGKFIFQSIINSLN